MRTAVLTGLVVVFGYAATAQFSLLPQVGFENSKVNLQYDDLNFSPLGVKFSPVVSLRADYKFKKGHGPYFSVSTSRTGVDYSFTNPETGSTSYVATYGGMQFRLEGGYQHSFKPLYFNNNRSKKSTGASKAKSPSAVKTKQVTTSNQQYYVKKSCGGKLVVVKTNVNTSNANVNKCGSKVKQSIAKKKVNNSLWMRFQPSLGMGFVPGTGSSLISKAQGGQTTYQYSAGDWSTAVFAGAGFEFGRKKQRLFTVSANYFRGIGNLDQQTLTTVSGTKTTVTHLESAASGWNVKIGIPFTLARKPAEKPKETKEKKECIPYKIQYKCGGQRS